ncbi:hypothetical protein QJS04_geneDACA009347 [Acorus gramineus]|uniref:Uncharacterized protein n=1 Tax=Acorus gramineus TaxID=55184 RepID=A0AAV9AFC6_ACOGR|nr:hypothetical protein QJS04_geneDACA009347 [Acorus gramineus]
MSNDAAINFIDIERAQTHPFEDWPSLRGFSEPLERKREEMEFPSLRNEECEKKVGDGVVITPQLASRWLSLKE